MRKKKTSIMPLGLSKLYRVSRAAVRFVVIEEDKEP